MEQEMSVTTRIRAPFTRHWVLALLLAVGVAGSFETSVGAATDLTKPTGPVILTVTGAISMTNAPGKAEFDLEMLEALGLEHLTTNTSWTDGPQQFEGALAETVLDAVGAKGTVVEAVALNDYVAEIPIEMLRDYPILLAIRHNGTVMTPRDKGPVWIVFPRDDYPELNDPRIDLRWVWQLRTINVR